MMAEEATMSRPDIVEMEAARGPMIAMPARVLATDAVGLATLACRSSASANWPYRPAMAQPVTRTCNKCRPCSRKNWKRW